MHDEWCVSVEKLMNNDNIISFSFWVTPTVFWSWLKFPHIWKISTVNEERTKLSRGLTHRTIIIHFYRLTRSQPLGAVTRIYETSPVVQCTISATVDFTILNVERRFNSVRMFCLAFVRAFTSRGRGQEFGCEGAEGCNNFTEEVCNGKRKRAHSNN